MENNYESFLTEADRNTYGQVEKLTSEIYINILAKKEAVIKERLNQLGLISLIEDIKSQRFKRIMCEKHPDREDWYADDGSLKGVRIVTFKSFEPKYDVNDGYKVKIDVVYF
jgi:hypothetical protein